MPLQSEARKNSYFPPKLNKLSPEQATLILIGHSSSGDQGAKDLLHVLYPPSEPEGNHKLRANFEDEGSAEIKIGTSRLIRRALMALQSKRKDFRRFVRG